MKSNPTENFGYSNKSIEVKNHLQILGSCFSVCGFLASIIFGLLILNHLRIFQTLERISITVVGYEDVSYQQEGRVRPIFQFRHAGQVFQALGEIEFVRASKALHFERGDKLSAGINPKKLDHVLLESEANVFKSALLPSFLLLFLGLFLRAFAARKRPTRFPMNLNALRRKEDLAREH